MPEIRERSSWFWSHLLVSSVVYTEWKNIIGRIAQVKELVGEAPVERDPPLRRDPDAARDHQEVSDPH